MWRVSAVRRRRRVPERGEAVKVSYKYEIKGKRSKRLLCRYAWAVNQVWNFCAHTQRKVQRDYREGLRPRWPSHFDLAKMAGGTSTDLGVHAQSIQGVCAQFATSRDQHKKCPRFRKSGGPKKSLGWVPFQPQSRSVGANFVRYLGHDFHFFGAKRRPLPAVVKGGSFVEDARGRWYVCLHVDVNADMHSGVDAVGIDLGLKSLVTLSTGDRFHAPQTFRQHELALASAQRAGNRARAKAISARIANSRRDYLHKLSTKIVRNFGAIYVGDVSSSALGKTKMAKSVYDAGWSTLRTMLRFKASRHGATYADVDEKFTTQTCSTCGALPPSRPKGIAGLGVREWECSDCGATHDRDVNAARNILAIGLSAQPLAEESRVAHGR